MKLTKLALGGAVLALGWTALATTPASAVVPAGIGTGASCLVPDHTGPAASARGGDAHGHAGDTRPVSAEEQARIRKEVRTKVQEQGLTMAGAADLAASVPVYVHVMRDSAGNGDVTDSQVAQQIDVLNQTYAGAESGSAADLGFTFTLAGIDRYDNDTWHNDGATETYRAQTRQGGADALNMWLVDFDYLGVATFPWDYASDPDIDGIRVQYSSLPGGDATNYNLGKTATHEAGHWFGLYHTFQGACSTTNDEVSDTPAQSGPTSGCPAGADTCSSSGLDPIHNYMDYSYDDCYDQFTPGQSDRAGQMWAAYRA